MRMEREGGHRRTLLAQEADYPLVSRARGGEDEQEFLNLETGSSSAIFHTLITLNAEPLSSLLSAPFTSREGRGEGEGLT